MNSDAAGWIIDKDHLNIEGYNGRNIGQTKGDLGQSGSGFFGGSIEVRRFEEDHRPHIEDPQHFRIEDEDGELYYTGRICGEWAKGYEEEVFAPLTFATANDGATVLKINGEHI